MDFMDFAELEIGDIFLAWYDYTTYMKIPLCKQGNKIYNAIYMFGKHRGKFAYFTASSGVTLHDEINTLK